MILDIGDRVLVKKNTLLSKLVPFNKRKFDFIANVINSKGELIEFGPPVFSKVDIHKYINTDEYSFVILRPTPPMSIAQKAIWQRKIKLLEGKTFSKKNKNVNINTFDKKEKFGAGTGTLLADNHCGKLEIDSINSPSDYLKLVREGHFKILFDSQE